MEREVLSKNNPLPRPPPGGASKGLSSFPVKDTDRQEPASAEHTSTTAVGGTPVEVKTITTPLTSSSTSSPTTGSTTASSSTDRTTTPQSGTGKQHSETTKPSTDVSKPQGPSSTAPQGKSTLQSASEKTATAAQTAGGAVTQQARNVGERASEGSQRIKEGASQGVERAKDTAQQTARRATETAQLGAQRAKEGAEGLKETAEQGAGRVEEGAEQTYESARSWADWGTAQASQATDTAQETIKRLVVFTWNLFTFIPFWIARTSWNVAALVSNVLTKHFASTVSWFADKMSSGINGFSNFLYSVLLGRLRRVNEHIDLLVDHTPEMVREALFKARLEKDAGSSSSSSSEAGEQAPVTTEATTGDVSKVQPTAVSKVSKEGAARDLPKPLPKEAPVADTASQTSFEDYDLARAANLALHRLFDKAEGDRAALLAEARKLAWHLWMIVALQVTAARSVLLVTQGLLGWAAKAWLQMATAGLILAAMMFAAPVAAGTTALAWTVRLAAAGALWVTQFVDHLRQWLAPSVHSAVVATRDYLQPYLTKETATTTTGFEGTDMVEGAGKPGMLQSYWNDAREVLSDWLNKTERFTYDLLPPSHAAAKEPSAATTTTAEGKESDALAAERKARMIDTYAETILHDACLDAQHACDKASALAEASARTVVDVVRVLLLGMATRFDLPMLKWVPGMYSGGGYTTKDPDFTQFLEVAGKGEAV